MAFIKPFAAETAASEKIPSVAVALTLGAMGVLLLCTAVLLVPIGLAFPFPQARSYNEGWNVYHAAQAALGLPLYTDDLTQPVNYPFISFYVVGLLGRLSGSMLLAGRVVSAFGFVAVALACAACARRLGATPLGALTAATLYVGFCALLMPTFVAADDPQFLAQALSLTAFFLHLGGGMRARLVVVPLLLVLSLFTKHQELAVPAAVAVDMVARHRREIGRWCAVILSLGLVFIALGFLAGDAFLARLLTPRTYSVYQIVRFLREVLEPTQLPAAAAILWLALGCSARWRPLCATFGTASLAVALLFAGGSGVGPNIAADLIAAIAIGAGLAMTAMQQIARVPRPLVALTVLMLGCVIELNAFAHAGTERAALAELRRRAAAYEEGVSYLAAREGAAICEDLLLCYDAGKPLLVDAYNSREMVLIGRLSEAQLAAPLLAGTVATIQLKATPDGDARDVTGRFSPRFLAVIEAGYMLDRTSTAGAFYIRRP